MSQAPKSPAFRGGRNIAMKIPPHQYEATVAFYADTLGLPVLERTEHSVSVAFGAARLWLDRVAGISQAEIWLEILTDDPRAAEAPLAAAGVVRCDDIEALPAGFDGFWVASPAQIVHLVTTPAGDDGSAG